MRQIDIAKFKKELTKNLEGVSIGFNDPSMWVSTGNYALNKTVSGRFDKGIPLSKVCMFAGESGSGKSFIVSGNLVRNAQAQGIFCVLIDTENALDEDWLHAVGVDTSPDKLMRISASMIDDVAKIISDFMKDYKSSYGNLPRKERPPVLIVIDSLGMLLTPTDTKQFDEGDLKGDMGRKPRALNALVRNSVNLIAEHDIGLVATNHTYASQDMFNPDDKITGGQLFIYASSIVVAMRKQKLKEDEEGNKTKEVHGIRSQIKVMKTRYAKPFEDVEINIPYVSGMDPYSGLVDYFMKRGMMVKDGNKRKYVDLSGKEHKYFEKGIPNSLLDLMMAEFDAWEEKQDIEFLKKSLDNEAGESDTVGEIGN